MSEKKECKGKKNLLGFFSLLLSLFSLLQTFSFLFSNLSLFSLSLSNSLYLTATGVAVGSPTWYDSSAL